MGEFFPLGFLRDNTGMSKPAGVPDTGHVHEQYFFPLALGEAMGGFYVTASGSLIATLARDHGLTPQSFAPIGSAFGVAMVIVGVVAPWALRFGPVWPLRLAPVLVIAGTILLSWSPGVVVSLLGAVLACGGGALMSATSAANFVGSAGSKYLALLVGIASLVSISTTVLFAVVERLAPGGGRFTVWFVMLAALPALAVSWRLPAVPFAVFVRRAPGRSSSAPGVRGELMPVALGTDDGKSGSVTGGLETPASQATRLMFFCQLVRMVLLTGVEFGVYAWAVTRFEQLGASLALASALATAFAVGMTLGRFGGANFTHLFPSWYVFLGLGAFGTALAAYVPVVWVAVVGFLVSGVGVSCLYPIGAGEFTSLPGVVPRQVAAAISFVSGLGALLTPVLLGALLASVGLRVGFGVLLAFYAALAMLPRPGGGGRARQSSGNNE